jgi:hypothetical protein
MGDAIERYLDQVMIRADLSAPDERAVRAELRDHLQTLLADKQLTDSEVLAMIEKEFGNPKEIGRQIAASKGRIRTYFKKKLRSARISVPVAVVLLLLVRATVAQAFRVSGHGGEPMIPLGNRVLVNKLARHFQPGDIIVYRVADGSARVGMIRGQEATGNFIVARSNEPDANVVREKIVGRVFFQYGGI